MNKAAPWNIKGVDFDAREAAREAAEREGMSLGDWLNDVISDRAAELGADADDFDDDDRLNAVSARLARMRDSGGADRAKRRGDRRPPRDREYEDDQLERPRRGRHVSRNAREREVSWRDSAEAETLLENAIDAFEQRISRSQAKTARTLAEVAELVQSSHSRGARETQLLKSISRRLGDIESRVARRDDEEDATPVRGAIARLETSVEGASRRGASGQDEAGLRDIDAKLSEIAQQLDRAPTGSAGKDNDRLARIENKIAALAATMEKGAASPATPRLVASTPAHAPVPAPALAELAPQAPAARRPLVDVVSQIAQRQRELDGDSGFHPQRRNAEPRPPFDARRTPSELETRLTALVDRLERRVTAESAPEPTALSGLQGDIARMSAHIEKMREDVAARTSGGPSDASLDKLRAEIAAVSRGIGDLAPRASVSAIERSLRDMTDRFDAMGAGGGGVSAAPIEQIARELRAGMRELDARPAISALEQDMRAIASKIESLDARGGVDPKTIRAIYEQTREVRDLLSRAASASLPGERAQRELADLAQRIEHTGGAGVAASDVARIVGDIRSVIAEGMGREGLRALESRIESLSERIDSALAGASGGAQFAAFGERLDKLHRAVAQSLVAPKPQASADTQQLEDLVRDLAIKVDRAADPQSGRDDLLALQHQIENLSVKIERSGGHDETVASLERMINDLFGQLNETRAASLEAAESAARSAVREALADAPVAGASSELSRELADLRQVQDATDQRTHATLKAVHETLERVVDRLTTLEDDIVESRGPRERRSERADAPPPPLAGSAPTSGSSMSVAAALARKNGPPPVEPPRTGGRADAPSISSEPDVLIEPGAGRARRPAAQSPAASAGADAGDRSAQAGFIAAARRAALAAQAASAASEPDDHDDAPVSKAAGALAQARSVLERQRKPLLLSLAALIGLLGALQIARVYIDGGSGTPEPAPIVRPAAQAPKADGAKNDSARSESTKNDSAKNDTQAVDPSKKAQAVGAEPSDTPLPSTAAAPQAKVPPASAPDAGPAPLQSPARRTELQQGPAAATADTAEAKKVDPTPTGAIGKKLDEAPAVMAAIEAAAGRGDAAAQYELAARRADGNQTSRDLKGAAEMFEKSATKGFAPAQYRLGVLYERGLGMARDTALAKLWYQRAADRGNVRAMHNLAVLVADGDGKPDYSAAAKWFRRAAEYGVRDSQYNLAILYARGMGGPQDLAQAYAWFAAAAMQGDEDASKKREEIGGKLDQATLSRAKAMAAAYRPRTIDAAVNEVTPPPGGWQALQPPKNEEKTTARPKVSHL